MIGWGISLVLTVLLSGCVNAEGSRSLECWPKKEGRWRAISG
jgi:hypothetical protein